MDIEMTRNTLMRMYTSKARINKQTYPKYLTWGNHRSIKKYQIRWLKQRPMLDSSLVL